MKVKCTNPNCGYEWEIEVCKVFLDQKYNQLTWDEGGWVRCPLCGAPVEEVSE